MVERRGAAAISPDGLDDPALGAIVVAGASSRHATASASAFGGKLLSGDKEIGANATAGLSAFAGPGGAGAVQVAATMGGTGVLAIVGQADPLNPKARATLSGAGSRVLGGSATLPATARTDLPTTPRGSVTLSAASSRHATASASSFGGKLHEGAAAISVTAASPGANLVKASPAAASVGRLGDHAGRRGHPPGGRRDRHAAGPGDRHGQPGRQLGHLRRLDRPDEPAGPGDLDPDPGRPAGPGRRRPRRARRRSLRCWPATGSTPGKALAATAAVSADAVRLLGDAPTIGAAATVGATALLMRGGAAGVAAGVAIDSADGGLLQRGAVDARPQATVSGHGVVTVRAQAGAGAIAFVTAATFPTHIGQASITARATAVADLLFAVGRAFCHAEAEVTRANAAKEARAPPRSPPRRRSSAAWPWPSGAAAPWLRSRRRRPGPRCGGSRQAAPIARVTVEAVSSVPRDAAAAAAASAATVARGGLLHSVVGTLDTRATIAAVGRPRYGGRRQRGRHGGGRRLRRLPAPGGGLGHGQRRPVG